MNTMDALFEIFVLIGVCLFLGCLGIAFILGLATPKNDPIANFLSPFDPMMGLICIGLAFGFFEGVVRPKVVETFPSLAVERTIDNDQPLTSRGRRARPADS